MGRDRTFRGTDAEVELARFLCRITEDHGLDTVAQVAARFPTRASRSRWAEYLNGSSLIPRHLLGEVIKELGRTRPGWSENTVKEAIRLWNAADVAAPVAPDSTSAELVSVYRKLTDTREALCKAEQIAVDAGHSISKLLKLGERQKTKIAELTDKVGRLQESTRAETTHRLEQAQFRLSRVAEELRQARSDRYTAEQAQAALLREQQEFLQEVKRLQQAVTGLDQSEAEVEAGVGVEAALLPERVPEPEMSDEEIDRGIDERLDLIRTAREQRGAMLSEVLQQADMTSEPAEEGRPQTIRGTVITQRTRTPEPADRPDSPILGEPAYRLSRTTLDNPATSSGISIPASSTRPDKRRRVLLATLLVVILGASVPLAYEWMSEHSDKVSTEHSDKVSTATDRPSSKPGPRSTPTAKTSPSPSPTYSDDQNPDKPSDTDGSTTGKTNGDSTDSGNAGEAGGHTGATGQIFGGADAEETSSGTTDPLGGSSSGNNGGGSNSGTTDGGSNNGGTDTGELFGGSSG